MPPDTTLDYTRPSPSERRAAIGRALRRWLRRIILSILILATLLLIVDQTWVWYWRRIQIGHDTTRITAPIEPSGCPGYLAALNAQYSAGITPENNAAPLLLQIVGTKDFPPIWQSSIQGLLALGPTPLLPQFVTLAESRQASTGSTTKPTSDEQFASENEESAAAASPWNPTEHPAWVAWLKANDHALDLLQTAVTRPRYYLPFLSSAGATARLGDQALLASQVRTPGGYGHLERAALARSMMRLDINDVDGFRRDVLTTARFARLLSQDPTLVQWLFACLFDQQAAIAVQAAASSQRLTPANVESLLHDFGAFAQFPPPTRQIDIYERYMPLDVICKLARFGSAEGETISRFAFRPANFNGCMRLMNSYDDKGIAAFAQPTFAGRQRAMGDAGREIDAVCKASGGIERTVLATFPLDFALANTRYTTALVNRDLALTALALRAHKLRTGAFPDRLGDLPPAVAPYTTDRFTDQPLTYRRQAGGYLLYSFGPNQKDDGGTPRAEQGAARKDYDIVVHAAK